MKNNRSMAIGVVIFSVVVIVVLVFSLMNIQTPKTPSPISTNTSLPGPTNTPDLCAPENISSSISGLEKTSREFDDQINIARATANNQLAPIIADLQKNRRDVDDYVVPSCLDTLKADLLSYMNAYIDYYLTLYTSSSVAGASTSQKQFDEAMATLAAQANQQYGSAVDFANKFVLEKARLLGVTPPATAAPILPVGTPGTPSASPTVAAP